MVRPFARFNENRIEPLRQHDQARVGRNIMGRGPNDTAALGPGNGSSGARPRLAGLYLDKGNHGAPADNDVDRPRRGPDPAIKNTVARQPEHDCSSVFRLTA
jgi:hypothetical protein